MILDYPRHRSTLEYSVSSDKTWTITGSNTHNKQATYLNDLGIYFAWGYEITDNPKLPWEDKRMVNVIENKLDFFFGANIVYSACYYSVEGGSCIVPKTVNESLELPENQYRFFKFFNFLLNKADGTLYDRMIREVCNFRLIDDNWPSV